MKFQYKVWIHVEEVNEESDHYENLDLPFGPTKTFDNMDDALDFAVELHESAETL